MILEEEYSFFVIDLMRKVYDKAQMRLPFNSDRNEIRLPFNSDRNEMN